MNVDFSVFGIRIHDRLKPVYKYTSIDTAKKIISNCAIRFRIPSTFNDPFEFYPAWIDLSISEKRYREKARSILRNDKSLNQFEINRLINATTPSEFKRAYQNELNSQRERSLVFCSSEKNDDILMWSHYADKHRGVCIGLLIPEFEENLGCFTAHVNYENEVCPLKYFDLSSDERKFAFTKWIYSKSKCWSYEQEIRSLITNETCKRAITKDGDLDITLQPFQLCEIYFGVNTSKSDVDAIMNALKDKKYEISKAAQMKTERVKYGMKPNSL